jgi:leader peptidase (prepilin peptidase)/N-methyltransferase
MPATTVDIAPAPHPTVHAPVTPPPATSVPRFLPVGATHLVALGRHVSLSPAARRRGRLLSTSTGTHPSASPGLAVALPTASLPTADLPSAALPSAALPSAASSSVALPSAALPSVALSTADLPAGPAPLPFVAPVAYIVLLGWCVLLSVIDLRERRLPNTLTAVGALGVLGFAAMTGRGSAALAGALLLAVPYLVIHLIAPAAFGAGDVKLAVGLGGAAACGGAQTWVWAALGAPVLTALTGGACLVYRQSIRDSPRTGHRRCAGCPWCESHGRTRDGPTDSAVAHGPAMCLATVAALLLAH